mmetsp:Transcript_29739/g.65905  ORF Transcript_29739/g.65905 Transcript_29739/m.65905 type:complete len:562 (+) Transcript_29739:82-1767(+)
MWPRIFKLNPSAMRLCLLALVVATGTCIKGAKAGPCIGDDPLFTAADSDDQVYYPVQPTQEYAKVFSLDYDRTSKTIAIQTSQEAITYEGNEQDGEKTLKKHFFRQCGSTLEPPSDHVPNFVVDLPVRCVVITATPQIGYLMTLNHLDVACVYIGDTEWVSDKCFTEKINNGQILVFASETEFADALEDPDHPDRDRLDEIMDSTQSLIFGPIYTDERLQDNRYIPVMDVGLEYWEKTPQAIFEWVELHGAMYNKENTARKLTFIKEKRWQCVEKKVANVWSSELFERSSVQKPRVCWAYHLDYESDWGSYYGWVWANPCRPGGADDNAEDDYYCQLARACGAELVTGESDGGWSSNIYDDAQTAAMFESCDSIIYSSYLRDIGEEPLKLLQDTTAYKNGRVFDTTKRGPSNWHELRLAMYDYLLEDFCAVAGTHSDVKEHRRMFLRRVDAEPEGEDPECKMVEVDGEMMSCNTIGFLQQCHRYPECKSVPGICEDQKRCINKNFRLRYTDTEGRRRAKRIFCRRVKKRAGRIRSKRFTCSNEDVARKCAKRCGECCPQLG